jgi:hypothetical protein
LRQSRIGVIDLTTANEITNLIPFPQSQGKGKVEADMMLVVVTCFQPPK